jgi:hypothetical protein
MTKLQYLALYVPMGYTVARPKIQLDALYALAYRRRS